MRYFEKQAKDNEKKVSYPTRLQKHLMAGILLGPAGAYGASDKNLGQSNLGKAVGTATLVGGATALGIQGAKELSARHNLKGTGGSMNSINEAISGRGGFAKHLMGSTPRRLATAGALGLGAAAAFAPLNYWLGKKVGKTRPKSDYIKE